MDLDTSEQTQEQSGPEINHQNESALPFGVTKIGVAAGASGIVLGIVAFVTFNTVAPTLAWILGTIGSAWYLRREETLTDLFGSAFYIAAVLVALFPVVAIFPQILGGSVFGAIGFLAYGFVGIIIGGVLAVVGFLLHRR